MSLHFQALIVAVTISCVHPLRLQHIQPIETRSYMDRPDAGYIACFSCDLVNHCICEYFNTTVADTIPTQPHRTSLTPRIPIHSATHAESSYASGNYHSLQIPS